MTMSPPLEPSESPVRPFKIVTHKPGLTSLLSGYGAVQDIGISVQPETAAQTLWWMPQDWAIQVLRAGIELPQLLAPHPGWLAGLGEEWLHRKVGMLRKRDIPGFYLKHPHYLEDHPQVVVSTPGENCELLPARVCASAELANGTVTGFDYFPSGSFLQLDEMMPCVVEVRAWVAEKELTASCPYRIGMVPWESPLFLEMMLNPEGNQMVEKVVEFARRLAAEVEGPPGYAVDLGITAQGVVTVLRSWPAWSAEPLSADPTGVYRSLVAAHDFDGTQYEWRWTPDLAVYDRSWMAEDPSADESREIVSDQSEVETTEAEEEGADSNDDE